MHLAMARCSPCWVLPKRALGQVGLYLLLLGTLLFAGSLVGGALLHWPTSLAPIGGSGLMLGWVVLAIGALRH